MSPDLLRMLAVELVKIAQRCEKAAAGEEPPNDLWLQGKADGLRYASETLLELLEPGSGAAQGESPPYLEVVS